MFAVNTKLGLLSSQGLGCNAAHPGMRSSDNPAHTACPPEPQSEITFRSAPENGREQWTRAP
ncbi:hypothetical protein LX76_01403 [Cereibacter changlensis]|uniref:Uncharacterized protein n=1 Tax=Cereibacter changlensis TaxID=402884 RepID=A0A2W7R7G2_9RHOB|nr:hypothetical protein LX76_01403 [Cereibacter changlensis]